MSLTTIYQFREFQLDRARRVMVCGGAPVMLTPKAFDLLMVFVEHPNQTLEPRELISLVWAERSVTVNNFNVTLNAVRRALGESAREPRFIVKSSAGYRFVTEVRELRVEGMDFKVRSPDSQVQSRRAVRTLHALSLAKIFRKHTSHVIASCSLYAMLFAIAVILEVAYQFDQFGNTALRLAPFVFLWMFVTSVIGLFADRILTLKGKTFGLFVSVFVFLLAAGTLFGALTMFLPSWPITKSTFQTYPAQAAYLKDAASFLILAFFFLLLPFHFVVRLRRALALGRGENHLVLVAQRLSLVTRGAFYPKFWALGLLLALFALITIAGTAHLLDHLTPGPYMNLFVELLYVRWILYFGLGLFSLICYQVTLNSIRSQLLADGRNANEVQSASL